MRKHKVISVHDKIGILLLLLLVGCGVEVESTAVTVTRPIHTMTPTTATRPAPAYTDAPLPLPPTNTVTPPLFATGTPVSTVKATTLPSLTPTMIHTPLPTSTAVALFQSDESFPEFPLLHLWTVDGQVWASTANATYRWHENVWQHMFDGTTVSPFTSSDNEGRHWLIYEQSHIAMYRDDVGLIGYPEQIVSDAEDPFYADEFVVDRLGQIWWTNGRHGLLRYTPQTDQWQTFGYADIGFAAPPSDTDFLDYADALFYTNVALDLFGNIWVTACSLVESVGDAPLPAPFGQGTGVRWFDGDKWQGDDSEHCFTDIEVTKDGNVWLAGSKETLIRYDPVTLAWETLPLPITPIFEGMQQTAKHITLASDGSLWVHVARFGGASQLAGGLFHLTTEETWEIILPVMDWAESPLGVRDSIQVTVDNSLWLMTFFGVTATETQLFGFYHYVDGQFLNPNGEAALTACNFAITVDRIWVYPCKMDALLYLDTPP